MCDIAVNSEDWGQIYTILPLYDDMRAKEDIVMTGKFMTSVFYSGGMKNTKKWFTKG